jgi:hypothetical protein
MHEVLVEHHFALVCREARVQNVAWLKRLSSSLKESWGISFRKMEVENEVARTPSKEAAIFR